MATNAFQLQVPQGLGNALAPQTGGIFDPLTQMVAGQQAMDYTTAVQNVNQQLAQQQAAAAEQQAQAEKQAAAEQRRQELLQAQQFRADEAQRQRDFMAQQSELTRELQREKIAATGPAAAGVKLKPGERWNEDLQRVEAVTGSAQDIANRKAHKTDWDTMTSGATQIDAGIKKIDDILSQENKSAFESNFGGYNAYVSRYAPGDANTLRAKIESLKSNLKAAGKQMIAQGGAIGQITEREWPIMEQMIDSISPMLSEEEARASMENIKAYFNRIKSEAQASYDTTWRDTQYYQAPKATPATAPSPTPQAAQPVSSPASKIQTADDFLKQYAPQ